MSANISFAQDSGIRFFEGTYAEALATATAENKMVFIDCYTQWCGPCRMMAAQVFPQKEVGDFINPRFVSMKLDMENGEGPELNKTFKVKAYPTFLILDSSGCEISRFEGFMQAGDLITKINGAIDSGKSPAELQERYASGDRDKAFLCDYVAMLSAEQRYDETTDAVAELMSQLTEEEKLQTEYWRYWTQYRYAPVGTEGFDFIVANRSRFGVGEEKVTDYLAGVVRNEYSALGFDMSDRKPDAGELERLDKLTDRLGLGHNPVVALYKAVAGSRLAGDAEKLVVTYEEHADTVLDEDEQKMFLTNVAVIFKDVLTDSQRERLSAMVADEQVRAFLKGAFVIRKGNGDIQETSQPE